MARKDKPIGQTPNGQGMATGIGTLQQKIPWANEQHNHQARFEPQTEDDGQD